VLHTKLQLLLTKDSFHLSPEAEQQVQSAYNTSRELQKIVDEIPPLDDVS
jgi:hypothetical protein